MKSLLPALFLVSIGSCFLNAQDEGSVWHETYAAGAAEAAETGKDLLVVFTGTDWIEICGIFDREILSHPEFVDAVTGKFALVKLEYPENNKLPREEAKRKQFLRDAYQVRGFPTMVLTDKNGRPFGFNGYQPVTPAEYAKLTLEMESVHREGLDMLEEAKSLTGPEKAAAIAEALPTLPGGLAARFYRDELKEIVAADPEATLESTANYKKMMADLDYGIEMQRLERDVQWAKMIELTEAFIKDNKLEGAALQKALLIKAGVQQNQANMAGRIQTLLDLIKIDPKTNFASDAQAQLDALRAEKLQQELAP